MEQQEKRPFGKIGAVIGIAALILAFFVGSTIVSNRREQAYNRAIDAIVDEDYETGLSILASSLPSTYKEKDNLISLCRAEQALDAGDYDHAQRYASSVFFRSATPSADRLNLRIDSILDACHKESERKAAEELAAYEAKVRSGLPFVGMPERYVSSTLLGEYSRCERNGTAYPDGRKTIGNLYYYKRNGKVYYCVFCTGGLVAEVYDNRDGNAHYPGRLINGSTSNRSNTTTNSHDDSDPYHASDYPDEEEFYEEHWDDFFDIEDADTYWQEHH